MTWRPLVVSRSSFDGRRLGLGLCGQKVPCSNQNFYCQSPRTRGWLAASSTRAGFVSSPGGDNTKLRRDETVFRTGEDIRKPALDTNRPSNEGAARAHDRGPS
jgi:hypothetical protein